MKRACTAERHESLKRKKTAFRLLSFVGDMSFGQQHLELRNCRCCGSTLARHRTTVPPTTLRGR
jgi:hypothetical protein